jgi:hypothetical protein
MAIPSNHLLARHPRRQALKTLGGLAGLLVFGPSLPACGSDDDPTDPGGTDLPREQLVLFVPGFMAQLYTAFSVYGEQVLNAELRAVARDIPVIGDRIANALPTIDLPVPTGGFVSFASVQDHFDGLGVEFADMSTLGGDFNTQKGVVHNGAAIAAYLRGLTNRSVTIVSHSKGGLDTLQALLENADLLGETVSAWVALQAPFHGSPVADDVPGPIAGPLLDALGGEAQALIDLETAPRQQYMAGNANRIGDLVAAIPVISCYTTFAANPAQGIPDAAQDFAQQVINASTLQQIAAIVAQNLLDPAQAAAESVALIRTRARQLVGSVLSNVPLMGLNNLTIDEANDGLVTVPSSRLPGAVHRQLNPAADHAAPVMEVTPFKNFWTEAHRNAATENLVNEVRQEAGALA